MIDLKKLAAVGIIASSALILAACNPYKTQPTGGGGGGTQTQASPTAVESNVITYSDKGFSPASIKVKVGETVMFKNSSMATVQVNSAVHPTHTLYPELNIGPIASGESKAMTFTTAGTKQYHNHLNAGEGGTIVVE